MKTTAQILAEVRRLHAHQGPKVVRAYCLMAFRGYFGIREVFSTFARLSSCWDHGLDCKPFLRG